MTLKTSAITIALLSFLVPCTFAQSTGPRASKCGRNLPIAEFLLSEDANVVKEAFRSFRRALLDGDQKKVADHVKFPLELVIDGSGLTLKDSRELISRYSDVFTPYVFSSVRRQDPESLVADWEGISVEDGAVRFVWENDRFLIDNVLPTPIKTSKDIEEFLNTRLTCAPLVIEGNVVAYNWASRMPAFENIYVDHLIVDVNRVLSGTLAQSRIRVDFWGVSHLSQYNLPKETFTAPGVWRMYLRHSSELRQNSELCDKNVQETVSFVHEGTGEEIEKQSAIIRLDGESGSGITYAGLPCFEAKKQYFIQESKN